MSLKKNKLATTTAAKYSPHQEDLHPYLVHFREFSHIATELEHSIYSDWFEEGFEREARTKQAKELSRQALKFLQRENGTQENERVRVAVIGDFSSGKSSFINSLLGQEICPVNVAASTSSITTFRHGDSERIFLVTDDSDKPEQRQRRELMRQEYEQLVTHQGQKKNKTDSRHEFEIYYPFDGFRDVELYDTPGFNNSENSQDEKITRDKCGNSDVILFVFDIEKGNISADILKNVLKPMRHDKPEQHIIAIANQSDKKAPNAVKRICDEIRLANVFNQVFDYSSHDEMTAWNKVEVSASLESILPEMKKLSPCKIEATENGFVLTPLNPDSQKRKPIIKWLDEIRGQKVKIVNAKRNSELNEYLKQGESLLKTLQKNSVKVKKENGVNKHSIRVQILKNVSENRQERLRDDLGAALSSALTTKVIPGSCMIFPDDWRVVFDVKKFRNNLKTIEMLWIRNVFDEFISAIPIEIFSPVETLCIELQSRFKDPVILFKTLIDELVEKTLLDGSKCNDAQVAIAVSYKIREFGANRGVEIFDDQSVDLINQILDQLDIHEAKHEGAAETHAERVKVFTSRIKQFSDIFWSQNKSLLSVN